MGLRLSQGLRQQQCLRQHWQCSCCCTVAPWSKPPWALCPAERSVQDSTFPHLPPSHLHLSIYPPPTAPPLPAAIPFTPGYAPALSQATLDHVSPPLLTGIGYHGSRPPIIDKIEWIGWWWRWCVLQQLFLEYPYSVAAEVDGGGR